MVVWMTEQDNMHITFEILVQSLFSSTLEDIGFSADDFIYAQETYMLETIRGIFNPLRRYMFWDAAVREGERARRRLLEFAAKVIDSYLEQQKRAAETGQSSAEFDNNNFSIMNAIVNHAYPSNDHRLSDIIVFMIAGNDTTAHTLSFFIYNMARHPEALSKLRAELDAIEPSGARLSEEADSAEGQGAGSKGRRLMTYNDLANAEYLFQCIKETQRYFK
jgi:cytochrome P450